MRRVASEDVETESAKPQLFFIINDFNAQILNFAHGVMLNVGVMNLPGE